MLGVVQRCLDPLVSHQTHQGSHRRTGNGVPRTETVTQIVKGILRSMCVVPNLLEGPQELILTTDIVEHLDAWRGVL